MCVHVGMCVCTCVHSICIIMCAKTRAAVGVCVMYRHKGSTTSDDSERACIEKSVCVCAYGLLILTAGTGFHLAKISTVFREHPMV